MTVWVIEPSHLLYQILAYSQIHIVHGPNVFRTNLKQFMSFLINSRCNHKFTSPIRSTTTSPQHLGRIYLPHHGLRWMTNPSHNLSHRFDHENRKFLTMPHRNQRIPFQTVRNSHTNPSPSSNHLRQVLQFHFSNHNARKRHSPPSTAISSQDSSIRHQKCDIYSDTITIVRDEQTAEMSSQDPGTIIRFPRFADAEVEDGLGLVCGFAVYFGLG